MSSSIGHESYSRDRRISLAVHALGGEGGGVLAQWITSLGEAAGYYTQATSVPGVAQRTGATIYYVEMLRRQSGSREPVLCLMPVPGDVDIVLASELVEAGRAMIRGFVSGERTVLITSTHRVYSIDEKAARGDARIRSETILDTAQKRARRFISFDMSEASQLAGSPISAVMFGALAGAEVLPFSISAFREVIQSGEKASAANLAGFEAGVAGAQRVKSVVSAHRLAREPKTEVGRRVAARVVQQFPSNAHFNLIEGISRLMDYQDGQYAALYLDRVARMQAVDRAEAGWTLTEEVARYLALWMSYEDTIRVADLKTRGTRSARIKDDLKVSGRQIVQVTEFMHPRLAEVCDTLPRSIGNWLEKSAWPAILVSRFTSRGRFVTSSSLPGFLMLVALASLRRFRRATRRYAEEQHRIEEWLALMERVAASDRQAAVEIARCQRVIKGYGDTLERGLDSFRRLLALYHSNAAAPNVADMLRLEREKILLGQ